mmetsp:Transcript_12462/g.28489  ORF Transcript_12462/g.28489 Transcript_12462/m.28489 type:complete len:129 (+) Transcript_12462:53-439(+)
MEPIRRRPRGRSTVAALLCLLVLCSGPAALGLSSTTGAGAAIERAGGLRIMLGAAAVGAVAGGLTLTNLPLVSTFSIPLGAAAGVWCAQLPEDAPYAKAGDVCRSLGHAATAFFKEFQSEYQKQGSRT